ncbi:PAS modulated sigma54-dependent transcriptional regulator, Fis family [Desulfonema limicola]|uniref:PAS modulated sigma54-dependent transcriptional regulator, Fis family n=1 Tax=Desulfonema limicola TaxID=45656 RepID=A0A975GEE9_9BACT|nr:sigma 54-interacting transcriptional regulator [Desulfonema limicola]QTA78044.1 PAS modulated sigma54-dependent transcriptional regulator, Fis family [Desulfonema limicola]
MNRPPLHHSPLPRIQGLFKRIVDLEPLADEIPIGILILDTNRRVVMVNRALQALTGFSGHEAANIPCYHFLRSKICVTRCPVIKMTDISEALCFENDIINRDRQMIPVRTTIAPLKSRDGELSGFIETIEDMRPLRNMDAIINQAYRFANIIGKSPQMEKIFQILPVIAQSNSSVLITGETGTGKDLVAEAIHQASDRAKGTFIKVNCGALPETLLESELFGHKKGAFTGAAENKPGRFRLAHNGTLFLTEIGDLPLSLQVKLLTFLDDKVVYPLGSTKGFQADVRVIAATHRNLEQMVRQGSFRSDLLFRLNVVRIHLPPLREREADIRLLVDHFFNTLTSQFRKNIEGISSKALEILKQYPYPGNVRELRNIMEYAVNFCQNGQIQPAQLPAYMTESNDLLSLPYIQENLESQPVENEKNNKYFKHIDPGQTWEDIEKKMIIDALIKVRGSRGKASELLGWARSTLWRKMKQYQIDKK